MQNENSRSEVCPEQSDDCREAVGKLFVFENCWSKCVRDWGQIGADNDMTGVSVSVGAAESRDETVVNGDYTNCCKMLRLSVGLSTFIYWSTCPSIDIYLTVNDMKDLYCTSTKRRYGFKQE